MNNRKIKHKKFRLLKPLPYLEVGTPYLYNHFRFQYQPATDEGVFIKGLETNPGVGLAYILHAPDWFEEITEDQEDILNSLEDEDIQN